MRARIAAAILCTACYSGFAGGTGAADDSADASGADSADGGNDSTGDSNPTVPPPGECAASVSTRPLHRLTPAQHRNTVRDLFGDAEFESTYDDLESVTTQLGVRQFRADAETVVARKSSWTLPVFPCDTAGAPNDACADDFISQFGAKVFRRPVNDAEREWLRITYDRALVEDLSFEDAMDSVLAAMLQAPGFVYLIETGEPAEGLPPAVRRLTNHEVANRLSYFLWDTMPDDALFSAADAGELQTDEGLRAQAMRLLADPRAEARLQLFISTWLQLDGGQLHFALEDTTKDLEVFTEYTPALVDAMRTEVEAFVRRILLEGDGSFEGLLTSRDAYVNRALAELYGVADGPADDDTWAWVQLPAAQRSGLLTRAGLLTVYATDTAQSPIRRGVFITEEVMCTPLGEPPADVDMSPVDGGESDPDGDGIPEVRTVREETELRTEGDVCAPCHAVVNPAGFTLEHYDAIGRWQDEAELVSGLPIDSSGKLFGDVAGPVADGIELSEKLAASGQARGCFADRWMASALGVAGDSLDDCTKKDVRDTFVQSGNVQDLLVAIVMSDAFRFVNNGEGE